MYLILEVPTRRKRENTKIQKRLYLAAAPYLPYPRLLFLLNIFMTSSPWLSMKWKPRPKQKKNLEHLYHKLCKSTTKWHTLIRLKMFNWPWLDISIKYKVCEYIFEYWAIYWESLSGSWLRILVWLLAVQQQQEGRSGARCHLTGLPACTTGLVFC